MERLVNETFANDMERVLQETAIISPPPNSGVSSIESQTTLFSSRPLVVPNLPPFYHTPREEWIAKGLNVQRLYYNPWPGRLEVQQGRNPSPTLYDVFALIYSYLSRVDQTVLCCVTKDFSLGPKYSTVPLTKPWQPIRRRLWGFGKMSRNRSSRHTTQNQKPLLHHIWRFLTPADRKEMAKACPSWLSYVDLRFFACQTSVAVLRRSREPGPVPTMLSRHRAKLHGAALLRFDFEHGDLIRWLGGEYTNRQRDWNVEWKRIRASIARPLPHYYPIPNFHLAYRIQTEGVPLKANYESPVNETWKRNRYDNHPAVHQNMTAIEKKFAKEEANSFHIHFPRFLYEYINGLMINLIQWAVDKGKGRICIDCSNGPDPSVKESPGSVNTYIPSPKDGLVEECPPVNYHLAFGNYINELYRMRVTHPDLPIYQHADDIASAFRTILYHPDVAIAFASVYSHYLIIPVGQVFGARSPPSYYSVLADVRQALAATMRYKDPKEYHHLVTGCQLHLQPSSIPLQTVPVDSHHPPRSMEEQACPTNSSYVDDNAVAAYPTDIRQALSQSVESAFLVFGASGSNRRGDCFQQEKWETMVSEKFRYLGFDIDTRHMTITWPTEKREVLHDLIQDILRRKRPYVKPRELARVIGIVRSASSIAPWGTFLSFHLDNSLQEAVKRAQAHANVRWWRKGKIRLPHESLITMRQLMETLCGKDHDDIWSRPISLFVQRDCTHRVMSDASYIGIGGWSPDFKFLWRITADDLRSLGFPMKRVNVVTAEPVESTASGLHINPLEFLAAIINLWIVLKLVRQGDIHPGGYVIHLLSDNTSALAWMSVASRTKDPNLQALARVASALLVQASRVLTKIVPLHIPGVQNEVADALSRPNMMDQQIPSLDSVITQWSQLQICDIFLLPCRLLHKIGSLLSSQPNVGTYEQTTTELLMLDIVTLPSGAPSTSYYSTLQPD